MASISDPQDLARLLGVAHEPLLVGDTEKAPRRRGRSSRRGDEPQDLTERDPGPAADPESVARKILLDQLTGRARSRSDLAKKLASKNVPDDIAEKVLNRFEEVGLIDDAAFAREWVAQRQEGRGLARRALAQELRRKGIDDELAREALDTVDTEDEVEAAHLLVARKLRSMRGLDEQVAIRRLVGMLARKGYSSSVSFRVVREALAADLNDPEHSGL
jgi:regulatory protein